MEIIDIIGLIVFIILGIFLPVAAVYRHYQQKKVHWRILAKINNLQYTQSSWFKGGDFVYGNFRGNFLKLESLGERIGDEEGYTRINLSANPSRLGARHPDLLDDSETIEAKLSILGQSQELRGQIKCGDDSVTICYEQDGIESNVEYLQSVFDFLHEILEAYLFGLTLEGRSISFLRKTALRQHNWLNPVIIQLLNDIFQNVSAHMDQRNIRFFCQSCLTNYNVYKNKQRPYKYHGCRICRESDNYFEVRKVISLLDVEAQAINLDDNGILFINWNVNQQLCDFDEIRIIQANDEQVERFAVQLGNDTDIIRKPRYKKIRCTISSDCNLSENSLRVLQHMIGHVAVKDFTQTRTLMHETI